MYQACVHQSQSAMQIVISGGNKTPLAWNDTLITSVDLFTIVKLLVSKLYYIFLHAAALQSSNKRKLAMHFSAGITRFYSEPRNYTECKQIFLSSQVFFCKSFCILQVFFFIKKSNRTQRWVISVGDNWHSPHEGQLFYNPHPYCTPSANYSWRRALHFGKWILIFLARWTHERPA